MGAREPVCWAANAHRVSRGATWDVHGVGYYSPALEGPLSGVDSVLSVDFNFQRGELAVANGGVVDLLSPLGVIRTISPNLGGVNEAVTIVSYRGPYLYTASATDSKLTHVPTGVESAIGTSSVVGAVVGSTEDDSNPGWKGPTYTLPDQFVIEAVSAGFEVFSLDTGSPVSDNTEAFANTTSVAYREGAVLAGSSTLGVQLYDYAAGTTTPSNTGTSPALVSDDVTSVAITIDDSGTRTQGLFDLFWAATTATAGVSVFESGSIWDITTANATTSVDFTLQSRLAFVDTTAGDVYTGDVPTADVTLANWFYAQFNETTSPNLIGSAPKALTTMGPCNCIAIGDSAGLSILDENVPPLNALDEDYNKPKQNTYLDEFDRDNPLPWIPFGGNSIVTIDNERLKVENISGPFGSSLDDTPTEIGKWYEFSVLVDVGTAGGADIRLGFTGGGSANYLITSAGNGLFTFTFQAQGADLFMTLSTSTSSATGEFVFFDNVNVDYVPALDGITAKSSATVLEVVNAELQVSGELVAYGSYQIDTVIGVDYTATCLARVDTSSQAFLTLGTTLGDSDLGIDSTTSTTFVTLTVNFTATTSESFLTVTNGADTLISIFDDILAQPDRPVASPIAHLSTTYNTGPGKQWDGAWANDSSAVSIPSLSPLPDNSGLGNDLLIAGGTALKEPFGSSGLFGVLLDDTIEATGTVVTDGQLIGWEKPAKGEWEFRRDITEFENCRETAGNLILGASVAGAGLALIRWNKTPMDTERLNQIEADEAAIADVEPNGTTC